MRQRSGARTRPLFLQASHNHTQPCSQGYYGFYATSLFLGAFKVSSFVVRRPGKKTKRNRVVFPGPRRTTEGGRSLAGITTVNTNRRLCLVLLFFLLLLQSKNLHLQVLALHKRALWGNLAPLTRSQLNLTHSTVPACRCPVVLGSPFNGDEVFFN